MTQAIAVTALAAVAAYLTAAVRLRRRGDAWPPTRDVSFSVGGAALAVTATTPGPGGPFTAHMTQHLIVGMAAPLLLVLARPLTLILRVTGPGRARRLLLAALHSRPATWMVFPPLAALLDMGGLWALYRTPLLTATHHQPLVHAAVHAHILTAGLLFTFAVCRLDPIRRRWNLRWRGATLLTAGAAHALLAKSLFVTPPPGTAVPEDDLQAGARLMYYGGDLVEIAIAITLAVQWYSTTGRTNRRRQRLSRGPSAPRSQKSRGPSRAAGRTTDGASTPPAADTGATPIHARQTPWRAIRQSLHSMPADRPPAGRARRRTLQVACRILRRAE
ncbi:cytochrome c oxidase assembly protein [Streptomyces flavidovirens]|uniref:cytochrome c oxidase assembly protein n=1 Tax=Streptomyces flavidovirens TaxID=67298 RepID=UPI0033BE0A29